MLALLSPAKTLDYKRPFPPIDPSMPRFGEETDRLVKSAARLGAKKLSGIMHISDNLATLNADRFKRFADMPERPALYAFAGDVYIGFEARNLDAPAIDFAQDHVRILSGLYGLLRPLDAIRPYRLEMGTRWAPRKSNLYGYWGSKIGDLLAADLEAEGSGVVLNLASKEYWHAVETAPPAGARIITVDFRETGPDGPYFNSFGAKRARGMMARYLCEHRIDDPEAIKGFDSSGYRFDAAGSEGDTWRFVRG
jgi:cytoplasmic iron level regulating protein YaaA (DUF328/UPF0246 family)